MDERSLRFRRNGNVLSTDNDAVFIPLSGLRIRMEELHPFRYSSVPVHALYAVFLFPSFFLYPLFPVFKYLFQGLDYIRMFLFETFIEDLFYKFW